MATLIELARQLTQAKQAEQDANKARLNIEAQILNHPDVQSKMKTEGSTTFKDLGLSIATGFTRAWDVKKLEELQIGIKTEFFPFKTELKEDRKASKVIEERFPDLWAQLSTALTLKPKKPALTIKDSQ